MKFAYKFSNLLGTVYRGGNVEFLPKKDTLASPVGNRLSLFNLKENQSETLPVTTAYNITCMAFSPDGCMAILVDEQAEASLVSLLSRTVIHKFRFNSPVNRIMYSPDGKKFAVAMGRTLFLYHAPGKTREINPFSLYRTFHGAYDDITCLDWTDDSSGFVAGGRDMSSRVYAAKAFKNFHQIPLGGHNEELMGCFFEENTLDLYTVCRKGTLNVWEANMDLEDLIEGKNEPKNGAGDEEDKENDLEWLRYSRKAKHFYHKEGEFDSITSVAFHKRTHIIVAGFESGSFVLHELPDFNLIHSLSISEQQIASITFNQTGDWLAIACSGVGQLLVWEWQSETYILKQHGHFNNMRCMDYSPDGRYLVTGGEDSKVKIWNTSSGFCFVTFTEHTAPVTGVAFTSNGFVVVSASLDGTVRAFDLHRYRNFRTFTSPRPAQFICLAVDQSGEMICAGSHDTFDIFLWSMRTGRLLEVMAGHEAPVAALTFSSSDAVLASGSWDGTVRLWNVLEGKGARETLDINHEVLAVTFSPNGSQLAVSALNGEITFWDVNTATQMGAIECRRDIESGRGELDRISAKTKTLGKAFDTISYTPDGTAIITGGKFVNICIYNVKECLLVKKFRITQNLSFDATEEFLDKRKMTEFGPSALIDMTDGKEVAIKLPGVKTGDMSLRSHKPEVRVASVKFSPTGREWAAVTTEGLLIYSLDVSMVFDPFDLEVEIEPATIRAKLKEEDFSMAIMMSFRLNEDDIITEVLENVPTGAIELISGRLPLVYVEKLLNFIANQLSKSRHFHFYLLWCKFLLLHHTLHLKTRSDKILHVLNNLLKKLSLKKEELGKLCDTNKYQIEFILSLSNHLTTKRPKLEEPLDGNESDDSWDEMVAENFE